MKKNGPVKTDEIIGQRAYFRIRQHEEMAFFGIREPQFHARVVGLDGFGVWIENPQWEFTRLRDDEGKIIPPEERRKEVHLTHILIFWSNIISIMTCPGREGFDVHEAKEIGGVDEARYL